jgi:hypothetical protein
MQDRLKMFGSQVRIERIALNMDQVQQYNPPPNPAKETDSRFKGYIEIHGGESWELDALDPHVITDLIENAITSLTDQNLRDCLISQQKEHRRQLATVANRWTRVVKFVNKLEARQ